MLLAYSLALLHWQADKHSPHEVSLLSGKNASDQCAQSACCCHAEARRAYCARRHPRTTRSVTEMFHIGITRNESIATNYTCHCR